MGEYRNEILSHLDSDENIARFIKVSMGRYNIKQLDIESILSDFDMVGEAVGSNRLCSVIRETLNEYRETE